MRNKRKFTSYSKRYRRYLVALETENDLVNCEIDSDDSHSLQSSEENTAGEVIVCKHTDVCSSSTMYSYYTFNDIILFM